MSLSISIVAQGRRLHRRKIVPQGSTTREARRRVGAFEEDVLLDMAFGAPEMMHLPLPCTQMQEGNYGCGRSSVRRCRALVASAALSIQDSQLQAALDRDRNFTVRCMKLGWDETEVRMYCSLRRAQHLFPSLRYSEEDADCFRSRREARRGCGPVSACNACSKWLA